VGRDLISGNFANDAMFICGKADQLWISLSLAECVLTERNAPFNGKLQETRNTHENIAIEVIFYQ
jgi:hypothetical protein